MMLRTTFFGYDVYYDVLDSTWRYMDSHEDVAANKRPCPVCLKHQTPQGYDPCYGHLEGVVSACCGHGKHEPIIIHEGDPDLPATIEEVKLDSEGEYGFELVLKVKPLPY